MNETIDEHLSERAIEYADDHIGVDIQMAALAMPPVPRDRVEDVVESYRDDAVEFEDPLRSHLYDLTDLALAINHSGDPMLDHSVGDEDPYTVTDETVAEIKIARGALLSSFNRELEACARRLDIDPEQEDLVAAIRDELEYSVDHDIEQEWPDDFSELE